MMVCKFGGTSLANVEQIKRAKQIFDADPGRKCVVVSAPGKRSPGDTKITDLLYQTHEAASKGEDFSGPLGTIMERFQSIRDALAPKLDLEPFFTEIEEKLKSGASADYAASRGEFLNALVLSDFFQAKLLKGEDVIRLTVNGDVDPESYGLLERAADDPQSRYIVPGFYGLDPKGEVKTFSRGGSDITGAVVARALGAKVYENWTDVSGVKMCDPRLVDSPKTIKTLTYQEMNLLGRLGAGVLHEAAVAPVSDNGIPICIKNTNSPDDPGTMITSDPGPDAFPIVGVAGKQNVDEHMCEQLNKLIDSHNLGVKIPDNSAVIGVAGHGLCGKGREYPDRLTQALKDAGVSISQDQAGNSEMLLLAAIDPRDFTKSLTALCRCAEQFS